MGGRRVALHRPRVRAVDGSGEVHLPSYELFSGTEVLGPVAMERMLAGLSTRRYSHGLEPVGTQVRAQAASGMTNTQLTDCATTARYRPPHRLGVLATGGLCVAVAAA
jgi:hypothetical protein